MSSRDSAADLVADWLNRRDGPPVERPTGADSYYCEGDSMSIALRRWRRWPWWSECEESE